jgi:hypothetical protein
MGCHPKQSIIVDRLISALSTAKGGREGGRRERLVKGGVVSATRSWCLLVFVKPTKIL